MNNALKFVLMLGVAAAIWAIPAFAGTGMVCTDAVGCPVISAPEPGTIAMLASGLGFVFGARHYLARKK